MRNRIPNDHRVQISPPKARELWVVGITAALLTAAAFVVFYGVGIVTGSEVFFTHDIGGSDIWHLNYPLKHFYLEELAAGRLPFWCPQIGTGFPLLAEGQVGALYPLNLLLAPLPLVFAFNWGVLLHAMLAGAFSAGYARQLGSGRGGSFIAAIVFAFSGFFVTHLKHTNLTASAVYIPLLLLLLERFAARRTAVTMVVFAGATACMVLAGHPQIVFNNLLVAGFYASFLMVRIWLRATGDNRGASQDIRFGGGMLSAVGLGLLLAMPQILPSVELNEVGPRQGGMTVEDATEWEYHPKFLLAFAAPNVFGRPGEIRESTVKDPRTGMSVTSPNGRRTLKLVGFDPGDVRMLYWEMTAYLGLLPLALALMAFALGYRRPVVWMLAAVLLASILLALGKHGGLFQVFWALVPGFKLFRFHDRFLLYAAMTLAVLAGLGFTWIVARIPWVRRREMAAAMIVTAVCLLDLFNALGDHNPKVAADRWSSPPPVADRIVEHAGRDPAPFRVTDTDGDRFVFVNAYFRARGWAGDLSPYDVARNMLHPNLNLLYGLTHHQFYFQLYPHWMHDASRLFYVPPRPIIAPEGGFKRIADLFNVRYVISPAGPAFAFDRPPEPTQRSVDEAACDCHLPGGPGRIDLVDGGREAAALRIRDRFAREPGRLSACHAGTRWPGGTRTVFIPVPQPGATRTLEPEVRPSTRGPDSPRRRSTRYSRDPPRRGHQSACHFPRILPAADPVGGYGST